MNEPIHTDHEPSRELEQQYVVRPLQSEDLNAVEAIARQWVRFPAETGPVLEGEVQEMLDYMQESMAGENDRYYFVLTLPHGEVAGFVCIASLDEAMQQFVTTARPIELKNLYVDKGARKGKGVGSTLYTFAKQWAKEQNYTELLLNSGPRYQETGWPFYQKVVGDPVGILKDFYGIGLHAPVWREELI